MASSPLRVFLLGISIASLSASVARTADIAKPEPVPPQIAPASDEGERAIQGFKVPEGLAMELFAAEPMLANPVAFYVDYQGRVFVAETFRQGQGVEDNRNHMTWLDDDLAAQTVEDRLNFFKKHLGEKVHEYTRNDDRIRLLEDRDGDGQADQATVFADGFNGIVEGTGAGLLVRDGDVFYTNIPHLWRLRDNDGDGKADERTSLHYGYGVRVAFRGHDMHGLRLGPDGKLYYSIGDRGFNVTQEGRTLANPTTGAVFRCNPDGSELEVFAIGLRNPQELAFDEYGNLFTGDNNSDSGDRARWVYVVEGGDSGWRMSYQYFKDRGPWNREKLWHPQHPGQAAYIVPPVQNMFDGPSGLTYYPGTGLTEDYRGTFFLCDFRGGKSNSGIHTVKVKPKGASFEIADHGQFVWSILCTDADFGPDGSFYISDWVDGWNGPGKGRIYRVFDADTSGDDLTKEVKHLLASGIKGKSLEQLIALLRHPDMRVRQESQFALAAEGSEVVPALAEAAQAKEHQLARIHAIWAMGQIGRNDRRALEPVLQLAGDDDPEIRAQAAKVLGDGRFEQAFDQLVALLKDDSLRVRYFAALGLGKLGRPEAIEPILAMLRDNEDRDPVLRHAGVMGLAGAADADALLKFAGDSSTAARMAVLLALRRHESPKVATFLSDREPLIVLEAARAIHDLPIHDAMPDLAGLVKKPVAGDPDQQDALLRRALNANLRVGTVESANAVAAFAARKDTPEAMRVEALHILADWAKPSPRDRVLGLWRPLGERPQGIAAEALRGKLEEIVMGPAAVRQAAAEVASRLEVHEIEPVLIQMVGESDQPASARVGALKSLAGLRPERLKDALDIALLSDEPRLRGEARRMLARTNPDSALDSLKKALDSESIAERQMAIDTLAAIKTPAADHLLAQSMDLLLAGKLPPELELELLTTVAHRDSDDLKAKLREFEESRKKDEPLASYRESLAGGDAERGRAIFFERAEVSCVRCHRANGSGGDVGPNLSGIGAEKAREYLLESIVDPNRVIAKGFDSVALLLEDGKQYSGVLKSETADQIQIVTPEGKLLAFSKDSIDDRASSKSPMPEDVVKHLSKADLRDLVEFLVTQKTPPQTKHE